MLMDGPAPILLRARLKWYVWVFTHIVQRSAKHPRSGDHFRAHLARTRITVLLIEFFALLLFIASTFGIISYSILLAFSSFPNVSLFEFVLAYNIFFFGSLFEYDLGVVSMPSLGIIGAMAGFTKLVLHTLLLGAVVFKFFVGGEVFTTRSKVAVYQHDRLRDLFIAVRLYNSTQMQVVDLRFDAYLRVPKVLPAEDSSLRMGGANPSTTRLLPNRSIEIANHTKTWPFSLPLVPYSVQIRLHNSDVMEKSGKLTLRAVQGHELRPENFDDAGHSFLVLLIKGHIPELGTDFVETKWFRLTGLKPDVSYGKPASVEVIPGSTPRRAGATPLDWNGWNEFDG